MSEPHWRIDLQNLRRNFEQIACRSSGVFSVMVESSRHAEKSGEVDNSFPDWVDRKLKSGGAGGFRTLASDPPTFRELTGEESQSLKNSELAESLVLDKKGIPRATLVRGTSRFLVPFGDLQSSRQFEYLAEAAGNVVSRLPPDIAAALHAEAAKWIHRPQYRARRFVFGDDEFKRSCPSRQIPWLGQGWQAGVARFDDGVIIDHTEAGSGSSDDPAGLWYLLLHQVGYFDDRSTLLRAKRWLWNESANFQITPDNPTGSIDALQHFAKGGPVSVRTDRFYSVVGNSREEGTDLCWASCWLVDHILSVTQNRAASAASLQRDLDAVRAATVPADKGKALERLMCGLLGEVNGFTVRECNCITETEEIDIVVSNDSKTHPWGHEGPLVIVECKNWSKKAGKDELVLFKEKIENRRGRCSVGILVSWGGFTAKADRELLRSSTSAWVLIQLDGESIERAVRSGTFNDLLENAWFEAVKR